MKDHNNFMNFKALLPLLKTAAKNSEEKSKMSIHRSAIINMSSVLGSICENNQGGQYSYRCSKVILICLFTQNMFLYFYNKSTLL